MSRLALLVVLLTVLTRCGGDTAGASDATSAPSRSRCAGELEGPYAVAYVRDGDSIMIRKKGRKPSSVRLIGVDAPEVDGPYHPAEPGGDRSKAFVKSMLDGESIYVEPDPAQGRRDKNGHQLAYVYRARDCLPVNAEIIRKGWAESYHRLRYRDHELFNSYEREARAARRGLWK